MKKKHPKPQVGPVEIRSVAPRFWECSDCGYLSDDPRVGSGEIPCTGCELGGAGEVRDFPPDRLRRLDERIRRYHRERDYEIVVILAATFLETMLEDILARIMGSQGATVQLRAAVLDGMRSIGQRIGKLFPTLTGMQFEDACEELGYRDFPKRWRVLRSERNAFIHDSAFEGVKEEITEATAVEAMILLDQAYHVFVLINNRFVADGRHSRHAPRP